MQLVYFLTCKEVQGGVSPFGSLQEYKSEVKSTPVLSHMLFDYRGDSPPLFTRLTGNDWYWSRHISKSTKNGEHIHTPRWFQTQEGQLETFRNPCVTTSPFLQKNEELSVMKIPVQSLRSPQGEWWGLTAQFSGWAHASELCTQTQVLHQMGRDEPESLALHIVKWELAGHSSNVT